MSPSTATATAACTSSPTATPRTSNGRRPGPRAAPPPRAPTAPSPPCGATTSTAGRTFREGRRQKDEGRRIRPSLESLLPSAFIIDPTPLPSLTTAPCRSYGARMLRVTRHGFREMLIGSVALVLTAFILGYFAWWWLALLMVPVLVWLFAFFRDPERVVPD